MIKPIPSQYTDKRDPYYDPILWEPWFVKMHSSRWIPWANKDQPLPYPAHNAEAAERSVLNKHVWWALRNFMHNITHRWPIGLLGESEYLIRKTPDEFGWEEGPRWWWRGNQRRRRFNGRGYGWQERGNFKVSAGSKGLDFLILIFAVAVAAYSIWW